MELTQAYLKSIFSYNPVTGEFRRKNPPRAGKVVGTPDNNGYLVVNINGRVFRLHRLAFLYMTGHFPESIVDHENGITSDNRWANLRAVTHQENARNQKMRKGNKTGVTGVHWSKQYRKWISQIWLNGKAVHLGSDDNFLVAVGRRKNAELMEGYHSNHGKQRAKEAQQLINNRA